MRSACVPVLFAAASLVVGVTSAVADPGGNSGAAHQCKQTTGKHGDCVSDAAHGATPTAQQSAAQSAASAAQAAPAAAAVAPAAGAKKNGGNSTAAHQCQKGGWRNWRRADQTPFRNGGACVSYAAHGGTLSAPKSPAQLACESVGGTFAPGSGTTLWFCTYMASNASFNVLMNECFAEGGNVFGVVSGDPFGLRTDACERF